MILVKLLISLFETNNVNAFPALTDTFPIMFLSNLFIAVEVKLLAGPSELSLAKGIAMFVSTFFPKWTN